MPATLDVRHQEGIMQLMEVMVKQGVTVTAAVVGRPEAPALIDGVQPDIIGTRVPATPAIGQFALIEEITRDSMKTVLHHLTAWGHHHHAKLFLGLTGKPGKGFHGFEQATMINNLRTDGWEIVELG